MNTSSGPMQPFWKDEQEIHPVPGKFTKFFLSYIKFAGIIVIYCGLGLMITVFFKISRPFGWGLLVYLIIIYAIGIIRWITYRKKWKLAQQEIAQIQQRAREKIGASLIGSAIHVAGNPKLDRDQNIVLALIPSALVIYPYDGDTPIDTIPLRQISAVHTVVYDDERTPHLETVDSTAQALQLSITYGEVEYDCLFRSMRKVRPIDWYQGIQKARILDGTESV